MGSVDEVSQPMLGANLAGPVLLTNMVAVLVGSRCIQPALHHSATADARGSQVRVRPERDDRLCMVHPAGMTIISPVSALGTRRYGARQP
jgi:hypothetical protein